MSTGPTPPPGGGPTPPPSPPPGPPPPQAAAGPPASAAPQLWAGDPYNESVDLNQVLTPEQHEEYKHTQLRPGVPAWAFVVLTILTIGLFGTIYLQLKQSKLPKVKPDDPGAGKAIGFMFIPYFNIYWYFVVWPRLVDRINFQFRLRGQPDAINRGQVVPALILSLVGWILIIPGIAGSIWLLVLGAHLQTASNQLAEEGSGRAPLPAS